MTRILAAAVAWIALSGMQAAPPAPKADLALWRLDCGDMVIKDYNAFFSDTMAYTPGPKEVTSSCYLIKHGNRYMLWDTGVSAGLVGTKLETPSMTIRLKKSIVSQLAEIKVRPDQIDVIGISHYHADHTGQAAAFPKAKLLIGKGDLDALKAVPTPQGLDPDPLKPWIKGGAKVEAATRDIDVYQDGSVVMLKMPGHTPGHSALLVRLASGPVLLSGDLWHFTEQVLIDGVPPFNTDRADTLASMDRFKKLAKNLRAKTIIQHEPADIGKLPRFPDAAR